MSDDADREACARWEAEAAISQRADRIAELEREIAEISERDATRREIARRGVLAVAHGSPVPVPDRRRS